ncbi:MAG: hypothetical protein BZ133_01075 [Methanosphaera sp. SHI613]|jgi:hypothetical protein|nr:MAG: hypothetical protein BZ133_01075 [Methanosphaera sp. SHI613]
MDDFMTDNYESSINEITQTLNHIINFLNKTDINYTEDFFDECINLYGLINYSRNQFLPKTSSFITDNHAFNDIFFNYTSVESMILDLFLIIESDIIKTLDKNYVDLLNTDKIKSIITFSSKLLDLLNKIIDTRIRLNKQIIDQNEYAKLNKQFTNDVFNMQNDFYKLVYDEKIDFRVK